MYIFVIYRKISIKIDDQVWFEKNLILFLGQIAQPYLQPPRLLTTPPKTFGENKRYNYSV